MPTCDCLAIRKSNEHGAVYRHKWWSVHVRPPNGVGIHDSLPWLFLKKIGLVAAGLSLSVTAGFPYGKVCV